MHALADFGPKYRAPAAQTSATGIEAAPADADRQTIICRLRAAIESNPGRGVYEIEVDDLDIERLDLGDGTATLMGPLVFDVDPADGYDDAAEREAEYMAEREAQATDINERVVL